MVRASNVLIGFDTYPHIDMYERGWEAADLIRRFSEERMIATAAWEIVLWQHPAENGLGPRHLPRDDVACCG
jgi:microcystin degradation protein MlrC